MIRKKRFRWIDKRFKNFLFNYFSEKFQFKYRNQIRICFISKKKTFQILIEDLKFFDFDLFLYINHKPLECMNCFEFIISKIIKSFLHLKNENGFLFKTIQIVLISSEKSENLKSLNSKVLEKLITLEIKVIWVSSVKIKVGNLKKKKGEHEIRNFIFLNTKINKTDYSVRTKHPLEENKEYIEPDFLDFQILKVKDICHFNKKKNRNEFFFLLIEREMVGKIFPGKFLKVTGVCVMNNIFFERNNYKFLKKTIVRVLGFQKYEEYQNIKLLKKEFVFDEDFINFIKSQNIYDWIISTICPNIFGQNQIKAGLAVLLFGGLRKQNEKNFFFDGRIKMLIVCEDDSIINSFFYFIKSLKNFSIILLNSKTNFFEKNSVFDDVPIPGESIYPKISENKNKRNIMYIRELEKKTKSELSDIFEIVNGISHLNGNFISDSNKFQKSSILSGINEKFLKKINFSHREIGYLNFRNLSNFDLIFSIKNIKVIESVKRMTSYYLKSKKKKKNLSLPFFELNQISKEMLEKYIDFTSHRNPPFLTNDALKILKNAYLFMRLNLKKKLINGEKITFTISIKQLESLIKISEALGRMKMGNYISGHDVLEGVRLFQKRFFP